MLFKAVQSAVICIIERPSQESGPEIGSAQDHVLKRRTVVVPLPKSIVGVVSSLSSPAPQRLPRCSSDQIEQIDAPCEKFQAPELQILHQLTSPRASREWVCSSLSPLGRVPPPPGSHRWDLWSLESAWDFRFDAIRCSLLFEDLISEGASFGPRVLSRRDGLFAGEILRSSSGRLCCRMGHLCVRFTRTCLYFEFCFVIFCNLTFLRLKLVYLVVVLIIWFFVLSLYMWFLNTIS